GSPGACQRVGNAARDELEGGVALDDSLVRPVGHDEDGDAEARIVAPSVDDIVHRAADDPGAAGGEDLIEVVLIDARRRAARAVVRPGTAEDPVVQPLATLAKSRSRPVVRAPLPAGRSGR